MNCTDCGQWVGHTHYARCPNRHGAVTTSDCAVTLPEGKVSLHYECQGCDYLIDVSPCDIGYIGTLICGECGKEMGYTHTTLCEG